VILTGLAGLGDPGDMLDVLGRLLQIIVGAYRFQSHHRALSRLPGRDGLTSHDGRL